MLLINDRGPAKRYINYRRRPIHVTITVYAYRRLCYQAGMIISKQESGSTKHDKRRHNISKHQHSCRHYPSDHWSHFAHFFLDNLVLSNFCPTVVRGVVNIEDLDSVTFFL